MLRLDRGSVKVVAAPAPRAAERGLLGGPKSAFPLLEERRAPGCRHPWYRIGPDAWVCDRRLRPGTGPVAGAAQPILRPGRSMPNQYLVSVRTLEERAGPSPSSPRVRTLREDSGFVLRGVVPGDGGPWRRTRMGYLPSRELRFARPSSLAGVALTGEGEGALPISWVSGATAWVHSQPSAAPARRVGGLKAYGRVKVEETRQVGRARWARIGPDRWVLGDRVRTATARPRPAGVGSGDRWIHVSLGDWTLVAYEGDRPVYATLISRGYNTPKGRFQVTRKLAMASLRFESRGGEYEAESVPWVVYFKPRFAFHSAYWHDGFGDRASHGCVNLSPADAKWLFEWTTPALPPGWYQINRAPSDPATHVIIE